MTPHRLSLRGEGVLRRWRIYAARVLLMRAHCTNCARALKTYARLHARTPHKGVHNRMRDFLEIPTRIL